MPVLFSDQNLQVSAQYVSEPAPSISYLNRLEPKTRSLEIDRPLKAEVRDALWMLTRQWQFGEFKGEDTGTAVFSKVNIQHKKVSKYTLRSGTPFPLDQNIPLETIVEREKIPLDIQMCIQMGQQWNKMLAELEVSSGISLSGENQQIFNKYKFVDATDENPDLMARLNSNIQFLQILKVAQNRVVDGGQIFEHLTSNITNRASDGITTSNQTLLDNLGIDFVAFYKEIFSEPESELDSAWDSQKMEYQTAMYIPNETGKGNVLTADEYYSGQLDWYSFDFDPNNESSTFNTNEVLAEGELQNETFTLIPSGVKYHGMPNSRWWQFEDGQVDLGNLKATTSDTAKILLAEFALIYGNDWSIIPCTVPVGTLSEIKEIVVQDVFGQRTMVNAAGSGADDDWQRWSMYNLSVKGHNDAQMADNRLFIPPVVMQTFESDPIEKINFIRDEMSNMVWGIESIVPDLVGGGIDGRNVGQKVLDYLKKNTTEVSKPDSGIPLKYELMNTVPENWIPFIPVHSEQLNNRQIQLQRGAMPRFIDGLDPTLVRPKTEMISGLNSKPVTTQNTIKGFFINEEEIPRSGIIVTKTYQRTRWEDGKIYVWLGRKKQTGRGEGSSGLKFDSVLSK